MAHTASGIIGFVTLLLERLDAIVGNQVTRLGRQLVDLPVHPRLGRLLVEGHALKIPHATALAAAMLSERDVFDRQAGQGARGNPSRA